MVPYDLYFMPYTHSLAGTAAWALAFAIVVAVWHRDSLAGFIGGLVVLSHWVLDWVAHPPDLTLAGGEQTYGLGLWNFPEVAMPLEIGITVGAFVFYIIRSRGPIAQPMILIGVLLLFQALNWFGPEPVKAGPLLYLQALFAFGIATGLAAWVGENRYFLRRGGLASSTL
jgi:hypothetical protein